MKKHKLLLVNDSSSLNTGYSVYGKEILNRLLSTGSFELAEISCYSDAVDPTIPWKSYPSVPNFSSDEDYKNFSADPENSFGKMVFENTLIDFKPDTVISFRDPWMDTFISDSPLRNYFNWIYMPPIDGIGQSKEWITLYSSADAILTYSIWAKDLLSNYSKINLLGTASPSADDCFVPIENKSDLKSEFGLPADSFVIGSVMRNQKRKLFPDLIFAFVKALSLLPINLASKTYLYLHTAYPDLGWDIPRLLIESGVSNRIYFTYLCSNCNQQTASVWKGNCTYCHFCKQQSCFTSSTKNGISKESMVKVYNLFDCLVQYSICEGFGMPQVEAAYCGVPVVSVNYSAMKDMPETILATPVNFFLTTETDTHREIANPDKLHLAEILFELISTPDFIRNNKSKEIASLARENYNYNKSANTWISTIRSLNKATPWDSPQKTLRYNDFDHSNMPDNEFIEVAFKNITNIHPKQVDKMKSSFKKNLFNRFEKNKIETTRDKIILKLKAITESINHWEEERVKK